MEAIQPGEITELLAAWSEGNPQVAEELMPLVFVQLRRQAASYLSQEGSGHTLQPTALVHEAYLRLNQQRARGWNNRGHFFAVAARMMRRILIDHARRHRFAKRGGGALNVTIDIAEDLAHERPPDLLALDDALAALASFDPQKASIVEMRYFVGLSLQEIAEALGRSPATISRQWLGAKTWLFRELSHKGLA